MSVRRFPRTFWLSARALEQLGMLCDVLDVAPKSDCVELALGVLLELVKQPIAFIPIDDSAAFVQAVLDDIAQHEIEGSDR